MKRKLDPTTEALIAFAVASLGVAMAATALWFVVIEIGRLML